MKIAFIGLGIMGSRMAANILKANPELSVYNRSVSKAQELARNGARLASSPAEAAQGADVVFTMLSTPDAVREAALGTAARASAAASGGRDSAGLADGFLFRMKAGSLWVDCSTVNPAFSREMANAARERGIRFIDAPVAGSKLPAERGELLFFVGGEAGDLAEARPLLERMGKKIVHVGRAGAGTAMKMVVNLMLGQAMVAFSEAVAFAESIGLERSLVLDTLLGGATAAPFLQAKRSKMESGAYDTEFPLRWMLKDLDLVAREAASSGAVLLAGSAAREAYALALKEGLGDEDFSAVHQLYRKGGR